MALVQMPDGLGNGKGLRVYRACGELLWALVHFVTALYILHKMSLPGRFKKVGRGQPYIFLTHKSHLYCIHKLSAAIVVDRVRILVHLRKHQRCGRIIVESPRYNTSQNGGSFDSPL